MTAAIVLGTGTLLAVVIVVKINNLITRSEMRTWSLFRGASVEPAALWACERLNT